MQANFRLSLSVVSILINFASAETPTNSQQNEKFPLPTPAKELPMPVDSWDGTFSHNSLFSHYSSASLSQGLPEAEIDTANRQPPMSVTRLTKPYIPGFDPHFSQGFFKPAERRHKPVTIVGIRKNGLIPKNKLFNLSDKTESSEVAELQSPYNDISNFWLDEPGQS